MQTTGKSHGFPNCPGHEALTEEDRPERQASFATLVSMTTLLVQACFTMVYAGQYLHFCRTMTSRHRGSQIAPYAYQSLCPGSPRGTSTPFNTLAAATLNTAHVLTGNCKDSEDMTHSTSRTNVSYGTHMTFTERMKNHVI